MIKFYTESERKLGKEKGCMPTIEFNSNHFRHVVDHELCLTVNINLLLSTTSKSLGRISSGDASEALEANFTGGWIINGNLANRRP